MAFKVIKENILKANEKTAAGIRQRLAAENVYMMNIISSPGAGKTTLLEVLGPQLRAAGIRFAVITGDCFTTRDAERMDAAGITTVQINTGNSCHIDAGFVASALDGLDAAALDLVIVENVGNLVCPAEFDVGEDDKIAILSVTEGDEKPLKYPLLFSESELVVINKVDLCEHTNFDMAACKNNIREVNRLAVIIETSCITRGGIDEIVSWISKQITTKKEKKR